MKRAWFRLGATGVAVSAILAATLGLTTLLGVTFEKGSPRPVGPQATGAGRKEAKLAANTDFWLAQIDQARAAYPRTEPYPGLSICVQAIGVDPIMEAVAKTQLDSLLLTVMRSPFGNLWPGKTAPPLVDVGCPSEPLPSRPGLRWMDAQPAVGDRSGRPIYTVSEPGFYSEYVFIMPLERINELLGGVRIRAAPQEFVELGGDVAGEQASATYITPEEVYDTAFLFKQLKIAAGLESRFSE